ncbi:MAG: LytTR family transcriptional regulator DNA-binding domain-containing protein [Spirosomataceae bacterium]
MDSKKVINIMLQNGSFVSKIKFFIKKPNFWHANTDEQQKIEFTTESVYQLLDNFDFLVQVNSRSVVNLTYLKDYLLEGTSGFMVIDNILFNIPRRFIPKVRESLKKYLYLKYKNQELHKGENNMLRKNMQNLPEDIEVLAPQEILFITRKGALTIFNYVNGKQRRSFQTLSYFENLLKTHTNYFIRIRRNCVISLNHLHAYHFNKVNKRVICNVILHEFQFEVARRHISLFRQTVEKKYLQHAQSSL